MKNHNINIDLPDAELLYIKAYLPQYRADMFFNIFLESIPWRQDEIKMFGKIMNIPRLQAWYGDPGTSYSYSGIVLEPLPWTKELKLLSDELEKKFGFSFNSVLLNLYENGMHSNGWHSDNEKELGINPNIASISLGSTRSFKLKHNELKQNHSIDLEHGSLLIMKGETQHHWKHCIPKTKKDIGPRINLTFRRIIKDIHRE